MYTYYSLLYQDIYYIHHLNILPTFPAYNFAKLLHESTATYLHYINKQLNPLAAKWPQSYG